MGQVLIDRALKCRHAGEGAATDADACDVQKPALDEIQPRAAGRDEVKVHAWMAREPASDGRAFMRAEVVQNEVQVGPCRRRLVEPPQELDKFLTAMLAPTFPN